VTFTGYRINSIYDLVQETSLTDQDRRKYELLEKAQWKSLVRNNNKIYYEVTQSKLYYRSTFLKI